MIIDWSTPIYYKKGGTFKWPKVEGVYVIAKEIEKKKIARYVGQGKLNERLKAHENENEPNECLRKVMLERDDLKIYYVKIDNQTDRENAEYTLFCLYGGLEKLCNEITPHAKLDYTVQGPFIYDMEWV